MCRQGDVNGDGVLTCDEIQMLMASAQKQYPQVCAPTLMCCVTPHLGIKWRSTPHLGFCQCSWRSICETLTVRRPRGFSTRS